MIFEQGIAVIVKKYMLRSQLEHKQVARCEGCLKIKQFNLKGFMSMTDYSEEKLRLKKNLQLSSE